MAVAIKPLEDRIVVVPGLLYWTFGVKFGYVRFPAFFFGSPDGASSLGICFFIV